MATLVRKQVDPSLKDLLDLHKRLIFLEMNCHAIATIQSFNSEKQTVTATINYKKTISTLNENGQVVDNYLDYPILLDVPVVVLRGGSASLTMPVQAGDNCVILFNDRSIDDWFQSGQSGPLTSPRLHSFSDGIALIGISPSSSPIADYDPTRAVLRNGDAMVGVGEALIKIANNTTTLLTVLENLLDAVENIITTNCVVGAPVTLSAPSIAALEMVRTELEGLLE